MTAVWIGGFGSAERRWAAGAAFKFPTGSGTLGSGKWSAGPALGYTYQTGPWTLGLYTQSFFVRRPGIADSATANADLARNRLCIQLGVERGNL